MIKYCITICECFNGHLIEVELMQKIHLNDAHLFWLW